MVETAFNGWAGPAEEHTNPIVGANGWLLILFSRVDVDADLLVLALTIPLNGSEGQLVGFQTARDSTYFLMSFEKSTVT